MVPRKQLLSRAVVFALLISLLPHCSAQTPAQAPIAPEDQTVLDHISADSLRAHLSFIASDLLEGRDTPSRGLDVAAEYIAAQFRRAGLEPVGGDGYFQTANWLQLAPKLDDFALMISWGRTRLRVGPERLSFPLGVGLNFTQTPLYKLRLGDTAALEKLKAAKLKTPIIITELPDPRRAEPPRRAEVFRARNEFIDKMKALKVSLIISIDRGTTTGSGVWTRRLIDPENRPSTPQPDLSLLTLHDPQAVQLYDALTPGRTLARLSLKLSPPDEKPVKLRNVVGLLRGSDPMLKDTYVLVTAHYDHLGVKPNCEGDCIYNGANDDGSGTASVIELALALASRGTRPKRSIVFMTVFGEEKGLLGSRYYGRHPIFPLAKTVADINLEHMGRTDDSEGPTPNSATLTGFDYSDLGPIFAAAGQQTGIRVYKHERNSDAFFSRSDNQALADQGVPAHTICVAFIFPDYHALGDHWDKVDYQNLAKVNRMVALGVLAIAENPVAPKWNEANPKAARYLKAWRVQQGQ
jgi:hypothetical protein